MVSVLVFNAGDRRFKHRSDQTKDYKIGICFSTKHSCKEKEQRLVVSESG